MGMWRGEAGAGGIAPPGMAQGGTIPVGLLPPGYMASRMAATAGGPGAMAGTATAGGPGAASGGPFPGRGLDSYRAAPIGIAMPARLALRVVNRFTAR